MKIINKIIDCVKNFNSNSQHEYQPLNLSKSNIRPSLIALYSLFGVSISIILVISFGSLSAIIQTTILLKTSLLIAPSLLVIKYLKFNTGLKYLFLLLVLANSLIYFDYNKSSYYHNFVKTTNFKFISKTNLAPQNPKIFLAADFFQSELVLPNWKHEIIRLASYLGNDNMHISIVENFSNDNTKLLLRDLQTELDKKNISNTIEIGYNEFINKREGLKDERIDLLSNVRNRAIEPIFKLKQQEGIEFDYIIFLNDIFFVAEDLIELINSNQGQYDMVCSLDFMDRLYDLWVLRDIKGQMLSFSFPYFKNQEDKDKIYNKDLVPVYSCWNGAIVMNTSLIYKYWNYRDNTEPNSIQFRSRKFDKTISNNFNDPNQECYSSECFLIFYDMRQKLKSSLKDLKVFINPKVIVTYNKLNYIRWKEVYFNPVWRYINYRFTDTHKSENLLDIVDNANKEYECMDNQG